MICCHLCVVVFLFCFSSSQILTREEMRIAVVQFANDHV